MKTEDYVHKHAPLVKRIAYHLMAKLPASVQVDDLIQAGLIGLTKSLAREYLKEGHAPLNIALSRSIEIEFLSTFLREVTSAFPKIEIKIF